MPAEQSLRLFKKSRDTNISFAVQVRYIKAQFN